MRNNRRPSPALVVSIIALVVATAGTATAATVIITSSSQIKKGAVNGGDIADATITRKDFKKSAVDADAIKDGAVGTDELSTSARQAITGAAITAFEAFRKVGPNAQPPNELKRVMTFSNLEPGIYAIFAKTVITSETTNSDLIGQQSISAHCVLDAGGDKDEARSLLGTPGANSPAELQLQVTRTFSATGQVTLDCATNNEPWHATDSTIIALKVAKAPRQAVDG